jgi:protein O-GlcNAc transferase
MAELTIEQALELAEQSRRGGRLAEAESVYRQLLQQQPNLPGAHNDLGLVLREMRKWDESAAAHRMALALNPEFPEAWTNLGAVERTLGRIEQAVDCHRRALQINPNHSGIHSNLLYALHFLEGCDGAAILREARQWDERHARALAPGPAPRSAKDRGNRRLRVGYVSPDFRQHVVGSNLLPILQQHDRRRFEIFCYSSVARPDSLTEEIRRHVENWRDIASVDDQRAAQIVGEDKIDILVDLTLHMARNRLLVFARKRAPVQATYLGYCSTTGLSAMDYRLSDPYLDPPGGDLSVYRERTILLPRTYWRYRPGGATPEVSALPALSGGGVRFGCLNSFAKVSPAALKLWAKVLRAVPGSLLLLHAPADSCRRAAARMMETEGVAAHRLEFVPRQEWDEYIQTYQRIDIALDPFPYGGGITTCDALWMGAPVVSLVGRTAVGRGGKSILNNLGLSQLAADTPERYVQIAAGLAGDLGQLAALRSDLRRRMRNSPLMDGAGLARDIESAYERMWSDKADSGGN